MNPNPAGRTSIVAAIMVAAGALLSGFLGFLFIIWGVPNMPRTFLLQDPIGFALRPNPRPLSLIAMFVALLVIVGLAWLFVRLVVRGALPRRGGAVFFGTWGAVIVASWIAGMVRAPLALAALEIPSEQTEILMAQGFQIVMVGASWGLTWGWLTAAVVALIHRAAPAAVPTTPHQGAGATLGTSPTAGDGFSYPPQPPHAAPTYPPQPPHAG